MLAAGAELPPVCGLQLLDLAAIGDPQGLIAARYDLQPGSAYLIRPDQYVAARWRKPTVQCIEQALKRAKGVEK